MNLSQLPDLHRLRADCGNPRLRRYYDEAIRETLAGARDDRLPRQFLRALLWVLLGFFSVSGVIGILAALQIIRTDAAGLELIWRTFVTSVVGLAAAMVRALVPGRGAGARPGATVRAETSPREWPSA
jgi:hypothetical protein